MFADTYSREQMVRELIEARGVRDPRVLAAMREVPRHLFVRAHLRSQAYGDHALPIGDAQTISQPYIVARMSELLEVDPAHKVLEVGTGTGYQTAILARLARWVYSLERIPELAHQAIHRMRQLEILNVKIQAFDGTVGWSEVAPFDRILVAAGAPIVPKPLLDQLAPKGKLLVPEGDRSGQQLVLYERLARGLRRRELEAVAFVPLVGRFGWRDPDERAEWKTMRYRVAGRVQGVGFRAYAVRLARACGVVGWVRNQSDGTVRAEATGTDAALLAFAAGLRMGPPGARVETLDAIAVEDMDISERSVFEVED